MTSSNPTTHLLTQLAHDLIKNTPVEILSSISTDQLGFFQLTRADKKFGDFASNLPLRLTKILKVAPKVIADQLIESWKSVRMIDEINFAAPGFINLTLSADCKKAFVIHSQATGFENSSLLPPRKILLEFVSANPTGPLHIGHGRWAVIGSTLVNLFRFVGYEVLREFYINDTGVQIEKLKQSVDAVRKGLPLPENGYQGDYIKELVDFEEPKLEILKEQKKVLSELGVEFDVFTSETEIRNNNSVEEVIEKLREKGFIYQHENATWFESTKCEDDKDRVLVRSDGSYTYFAVDVAYHYDKIKRGYHSLIDILGADHHGYAKRIAGVVSILSDKEAELEILIGQLVSLIRDGKPVRFSKRAGNIVELKEVMDEIGVDALRYYLSMRSFNSNLTFDLEIAKKKSMDNPIYYIQYAHARISSIFTKAETLKISLIGSDEFNLELINHETVNELIKKMIEFENEIVMIVKSYQVHHLNSYLYEIATLFHRLYNEEIFIPSEFSENPEEAKREMESSQNYLFLLTVIQKLIKRCLALLNITALEKM